MRVIIMPRHAREKSESGIYHIVLRGANRQEIFHDDEDNLKFLETVDRFKRESEIKVYGWCLMGNHVHMLVEEGKEIMSATMKRICVSYAWFYNSKYQTTGHLFQDRYRSEKIEDDRYLLTVIRYIHQNPVKAGIIRNSVDWEWSSCAGYYGQDYYPLNLLSCGLILGMFSQEKDNATKKFIEYNQDVNEDKCLDYETGARLTDEMARKEIIKRIQGYEIPEIKSLPKVQRDEVILRLKDIDGLSQRQTARILGISPNLIFKA
jgi:REP element-mobilizing transposase RayT